MKAAAILIIVLMLTLFAGIMANVAIKTMNQGIKKPICNDVVTCLVDLKR